MAAGFLARFDKIVEQNRAWDDLEKQGDQYNQQLEKALAERNLTKRAMGFGTWVGQYKALLSQARSIVETQNSLVDGLVADSARITGDANRYAREATDALREYIATQRKAIDVAEELIATIESYVAQPDIADPKRLEEMTKALDELNANEKQAFQRAQDAVVRLRAVAL